MTAPISSPNSSLIVDPLFGLGPRHLFLSTSLATPTAITALGQPA
jgi:hypothetical protein